MFFKKRSPKTPLDLIEDQLYFWRSRVSSITTQTDAVRRITELENHLMQLHKEEVKNRIPERIKSLEDTMAELMLMGREDTK